MFPVVTLIVGADNIMFYVSEEALCRVPFFRAALQGEFREATEKKITLPEDIPSIFSALLEHLYTGTYAYNPDNDMALDGTHAHDLSEGRFHASVYAVADKYGWQPLMDAAVYNFLVVLPELPGIDILRLWKSAYEAGLTMFVCSEGGCLEDFKNLLPGLLQDLHLTDAAETESIIAELPSLASDIIWLLVEDGGH